MRMTRAALCALTVAITAGGLATAPAASAVTKPPPPVTKAAAFSGFGHVQVTWTNPKSTSFANIVVRYAKGNTAPAGPTRGTGVKLAKAKAGSATLPPLTAGTRYSVAIWTRNAAHHYSKPAAVHFTSRAPAAVSDGTVSGTVTDTRGNPLGGVFVFAFDYGNGFSSSTTDAAGSYQLRPQAGPVYIGFDGSDATGGDSDATGYQGDFVELSVVKGQVRTGVDKQLADGAAISGHVSADGHALEGVVIDVNPVAPFVEPSASGFGFLDLSQNVLAANETDASGDYVVKGLPPGAMQLCADTTSDDVTGGLSDLGGYAGSCTGHAVITTAGATTSAPDFSLLANSGGLVTGTVTGPSGKPLADAFVSLSPTDPSSDAYGSGVTMSNGHFRLQAPAGTYHLCADAGGSGAGGAETCRGALVTVSAGHAITANVQLRPSAGLTGIVTGPNGKPLADAEVDVESTSEFSGDATFVNTDAHGRYVADGLSAGSYRACFGGAPPTASAPGSQQESCPRTTYALRGGYVRLGADARLVSGGTITGKVTNDLGQPLPDAEIDVEATTERDFSYGEISQADGTYSVFGLPTGTYTLCADDGGVTSAAQELCYGGTAQNPFNGTSIHVQAGVAKSGIDVTLSTGGSVAVTVQDSADRPLAGVDVAALSSCNATIDDCDVLGLFGNDRTINVAASDITGPDGTVTLTGLPPGNYALCVFGYFGASTDFVAPTGYADNCDATYDVTVTEHATTTATREMDDGGTVSGTVTDESGHPLAGVQVDVSNSGTSDYEGTGGFTSFPPTGPAADAVTDAHGNYTVHGVQPGSQTVCFEAGLATGGSSKGGYLDTCHGGADQDSATPVDVQADATTSGVDAVIASGVAISGTIKNSSGHVVRAETVIFDSHGNDVEDLISGSPDGSWSVTTLPAGTYRVCFFPLGAYQAQCFNKVPWNGQTLPPKATTKIVLAAGAARTGVNAALVHK